jgi:hypothetical protein
MTGVPTATGIQSPSRDPKAPGNFLRIGFLLNHEGAHQVGHVLPIALAMASSGDTVDVQVFVSGGPAEEEVRRQVLESGARLSITRLRDAGPFGKAVTAISGGAIPARRVSILGRNRDLFANLDALVVPEKTSLMLKTRFGLDLPLIHTRHGAGDRAIGFDKASGRFDLVLLSGQKVRDRLAQASLLKEDGYAIVGYPKFDRLATTAPPQRVFADERPIVLYNPHPSPALSSWYSMGRPLLEYFASQNTFNLVFAPHVMLFRKRYQASLAPLRFSAVPQVPGHLRELPQIHVDLGSQASVDMTYTRMADIYIGDASSQIYEFLARPRPCIFLNPAKLEWQDDPNFAHWKAGTVVSNIEELHDALRRAVDRPDEYRQAQQELFRYTFDLTPEPSARRAARAIIEWLRRRRT